MTRLMFKIQLFISVLNDKVDVRNTTFMNVLNDKVDVHNTTVHECTEC